VRCLPSFIDKLVNTRKADSVYLLFYAFKLFKVIERPADCETWIVIRFLNETNGKPADIHCQIYEVYGKNAMSDGMVGIGLQSSTKVVITCIMSRRADGCLWSVII
jgi:hypothetical protein